MFNVFVSYLPPYWLQQRVSQAYWYPTQRTWLMTSHSVGFQIFGEFYIGGGSKTINHCRQYLMLYVRTSIVLDYTNVYTFVLSFR